MQIELWKNFSKRRNSTKTPIDAGTTYEIYLKEDTDTDNPIVVLEPVDLGFTYARFLGNYYFVSQEVILTNNMMQLSLEMDPLASNKTDIGNTNAFIVYSSTGYDNMLIDSRIAAKASKEVTKTVKAVTDNFLSSTGYYVLSVVNSKNAGTGFLTQYLLTTSEINGLKPSLFAPDIAERVLQWFNANFMDSIVSCIWLPFDRTSVINTGCTETHHMGLGGVSLDGLQEYRTFKNTFVVTKLIAFELSKRYTDFRQLPPYTSYSMWIPLYGLVDLNPADLVDCDWLYAEYSMDVVTGDVVCTIRRDWTDDRGKVLQSIQFNTAVSCPISGASFNNSGVVGGATATIGGLGKALVGAVTQNAAMATGGIMSAVSGATNAALTYNQRSYSSRGNIQGRAMAIDTELSKFILYEFTQDTEDPDDINYIALNGRPVMQAGNINTHSGFIQCSDASFAGSVISSERDAINSFLNGGFYYE